MTTQFVGALRMVAGIHSNGVAEPRRSEYYHTATTVGGQCRCVDAVGGEC